MNRLAPRRLREASTAPAVDGPSTLDALASTWSPQEADGVEAAIGPLGQVDPDPQQ